MLFPPHSPFFSDIAEKSGEQKHDIASHSGGALSSTISSSGLQQQLEAFQQRQREELRNMFQEHVRIQNEAMMEALTSLVRKPPSRDGPGPFSQVTNLENPLIPSNHHPLLQSFSHPSPQSLSHPSMQPFSSAVPLSIDQILLRNSERELLEQQRQHRAELLKLELSLLSSMAWRS